MKIYVDYDDCLCETAKAFSVLAERLFGKIVPYEEVRFFNLQASFGLSDEEYEHLMLEGHRPEEILSYAATPGAAEVVNEWVDQGHEVTIITGRPFSSYEPSRKWLDMNGFDRVKMYCLNKYGRDTFIKNSDFNMELEDYYKMKFDFAVEDSPMAFRFFEHLPELRVLVYDRPWNQEEAFPNANYSRVRSWEQIREWVRMISEELYSPGKVGSEAWGRVHKAQKEFNDSEFWNDREPLRRLRECFGSAPEDMVLTPPVYFDHGDKVFFGKHFYANTDLTILDENYVRFGDNVYLAPHVSIYTAGHPIDAEVRNTDVEYARPVTIGSNVWIGGNVVINPGVTIGDDVVIGSGSVVTKDIPSHTVAAGNPCRVIRPISEKDREEWKSRYAVYTRQGDRMV